MAVNRRVGNSLYPPNLQPPDDNEGLIGLGIMAEGDEWPTSANRRRSMRMMMQRDEKEHYFYHHPPSDWAMFLNSSSRYSNGRRRDEGRISSRLSFWIVFITLSLLIIIIRRHNNNIDNINSSATMAPPLLLRDQHHLGHPLDHEQESGHKPNIIIKDESFSKVDSPSLPEDVARTSIEPHLALLLFIPANLEDLSTWINGLISSLSTYPSYSISLICDSTSNVGCPSSYPQVEHITSSILNYQPPGDADLVVIQEGAIDLDWLRRASSILKRPKQIIASAGLSLHRTTESELLLECSSSGTQAALAVGSYLFPTKRWNMTNLDGSQQIHSSSELAWYLATQPSFTTLVYSPDPEKSHNDCIAAIDTVYHIEAWSEKLISLGVRSTKLGILIGDLSKPIHKEWQRIACGLIRKFDGEVYARRKNEKSDGMIELNSYLVGTEEMGKNQDNQEFYHEGIDGFLKKIEQRGIEVLVYLKDESDPEFSMMIDPIEKRRRISESYKFVLIGLPIDEIEGADWILGLNLKSLTNWTRAQVDITVITNDRPRSLNRLLDSLTRAKYYGDQVNLIINMEQTSDHETREIVEKFEWKHGMKMVRQRVIQGGLLPAIVESWYPSHPYDSYGVFLEDDIEVSEQFYSWIKFGLLSYRYSDVIDDSIYGISLYSPQHNELKPEGRRKFKMSKVLKELGIKPISLVYSAQVPCSWGSVMFPEHWVKFNQFLKFRLSEKFGKKIKLNDDIIPKELIRSNKWKKSYKKYLIEFIFLKGFRMIYPNYLNFNQNNLNRDFEDEEENDDDDQVESISLSTNHLEIGTHVHLYNKNSTTDYLDEASIKKNEELERKRILKIENLRKEFDVKLIERNFSLLSFSLKKKYKSLDFELNRNVFVFEEEEKEKEEYWKNFNLPMGNRLINLDLWSEISSFEEIKDRGLIGIRNLDICNYANQEPEEDVADELKELFCF